MIEVFTGFKEMKEYLNSVDLFIALIGQTRNTPIFLYHYWDIKHMNCLEYVKTHATRIIFRFAFNSL